MSTNSNSSSPSNKKKRKRNSLPSSSSLNDFHHSNDMNSSKVDNKHSPSLIRPFPNSIPPPPIDPLNPFTWNVNDVCWFLNESGCSFALKTIKEQVK